MADEIPDKVSDPVGYIEYLQKQILAQNEQIQRRAVEVRYAEVEHFGAHAGKSTQHCQCRCGIRLPYPCIFCFRTL